MYTPVTIDRDRNLRFDIPAFRSLEDAMAGKSIGTILSLINEFSITAICATLWAGLKHEDQKLTLRGTEALLNTYMEQGGDVGALIKTLSDAIGDSAVFRSITRGNVTTEPATTAEQSR